MSVFELGLRIRKFSFVSEVGFDWFKLRVGRGFGRGLVGACT